MTDKDTETRTSDKKHTEGRRNKNFPPAGQVFAVSILITAAAYFLSFILPGEITSLEAIAPEEKTSDYSFSDFYTMVATDVDSVTIDPTVTIVAVDGCTRNEMGRAVTMVDSLGASAIGIDMIFSPPMTTDTDPMAEAIDSSDKVVLPVKLKNFNGEYFTDMERSYFDTLLVNSHYIGAVNINGSHEGTTTRYFKPEFDYTDGPIPSMAMMLAELHRPGSFDIISKRGNSMEMINFAGYGFHVLHPDRINEHPDLIKDHVVLIGMINDPADKHRNPLINTMPGIKLHAHIISTIINGAYIDEASQWTNIAVGLCLCLLLVFVGIYCRHTDWGCLVVRILQTGMLFGVLYFGSKMFINHSYNFDFSPTILLTVLGLVVMDIAVGLWALMKLLLGSFKEWRKKRSTKKRSKQLPAMHSEKTHNKFVSSTNSQS